MKTKFSPGPWRFIKQILPSRRQILTYDNCIENEIDLDYEPNRLLIEASPEIYAALRTILAYAEVHGDIPSVIVNTATHALLYADGYRLVPAKVE